MIKYVGMTLRAIFAAAAALGTGLAAVLVDNASIGDLTDGQWVTIALGALVAFGGVFGISNVKAK